MKFTLVSDSWNALAKQLNITFKIAPEIVEEYKVLSIDIADSQDNKDYELPMPAIYIIGTNQKVVY